MSLDQSSPSSILLSAAPCSMATVCPLTPSPANGAVSANGSPPSQSGHAGFAAALRKLAKQAEEPRGSVSDSSHVSSPTNHVSPVTTPKRVAMGTSLGPPTVTPPVVTIAPTKADRHPPSLEKSPLSLPQYQPFRGAPSALLQDPRLQPHVPPELLRDVYRYPPAEDLRVPLMPPGAAADALAYFHSGYLPHPSLASYRMEDYYGLSALRSHYFTLPEGGGVPPLHPHAVHLPAPSVFYPPDITHTPLAALHSDSRLQMEEELRQRERERDRARERHWEKERELEMKKERAREIQPVKTLENHHLIPHLYPNRHHLKERGKMEERHAANRTERNRETSLLAAPSGSSSSSLTAHSSQRSRETPMILQQRHEEDDGWLFRGRTMTLEKESHTKLERPRDAARSPEAQEPLRSLKPSSRSGSHQNSIPQRLGAPPPLITPKPVPRNPSTPPTATTSFWTPVSLLQQPSERPKQPRASEEDLWCASRPPELEKTGRGLVKQHSTSFFSNGANESRQKVLQSSEVENKKIISKLDLEEKRRREAREKGYYYELDDSYDESDEEEVRAHLRRVSQQPPLKLDACREKMEFLGLCGLTTLRKRDEVLEMKRRKRRRMLRERSPSPVGKRRSLSPALSTRFTAEEMNRCPRLNDKKHFLSFFSLSHVSHEERRKKRKVTDLLEAIKLKTVTLDSLRYATENPCSSPAESLPGASPVSHLHPEPQKHTSQQSPPEEPPPLAHLHPQGQLRTSSPVRKAPPLPALVRPKEARPGLNGVKPHLWERRQDVHQLALPSTPSQHKQKGVKEQFDHAANPPPGLQRAVNKLQSGQTYGLSLQKSTNQDSPGEGVSSEEDEEDESFSPRWKGVESIFQAYEDYLEEHQVLQSECRRLETHHYNLTLTAEQLSQSMRELLAQKHSLAQKQDRIQAELEHFRKSLALPLLHWHRAYYKGHSHRINAKKLQEMLVLECTY
ncbi:hypothetical protein DNTS_034099, partial [Danionella cerebrum]